MIFLQRVQLYAGALAPPRVAPPRRLSSTTSRRDRPLSQWRSVTAYSSRSCSAHRILGPLIQRSAVHIVDGVDDAIAIGGVAVALGHTAPADLAGQAHGAHGGSGGLADGFDKLITARTGIHTVVAENAISCVAIGTGKSLDSVHEMNDGTVNLSRRKQMN